MKLEVSIGEAVDKLSILELKCKKITDSVKLIEIRKEIEALSEIQEYKKQLPFFYKLLVFVNQRIWEMTDAIKTIDSSIAFFPGTAEKNTTAYASLAHDIFEYNQKRFRLKHFFNCLLDSSIKEQKSYNNTACFITIENETVLFSKLSELFYLSIEYDCLYIDTIYEPILSKILRIPSIHYIVLPLVEETVVRTKMSIILADFYLSPDLKLVFSLEPIRYINGGKFGDFIHSLSIINENYYETGRKGILYISESNGSDIFTFGITKAFEDTVEIIKTQPYIYSYSIYDPENGDTFDINLNSWRGSPFLFVENWFYIYSSTYNVFWAKHPWIQVPFPKDPTWENKVVINTNSYRFPANVNYTELYKTHGENLVFISMDKDFYDDFITRTNISTIPFYLLTSFNELCVILSSCKMFIGCPSGPLAVAFAIHTPCCISMHNNLYEETMMKNIHHHLSFIQNIY